MELVDDDDVSGWGECVALEYPGYLPETIDTALFALQNWLAPALVQYEFSHPAEIADMLDKSARGWHFAKASLEMAAWDLAAKKTGKPLAKLLGGTQKKVAAGLVLGMQETPRILLKKAFAAKDEGYRRLKIKITAGKDLEYLHFLRKNLGDDFDLAADANSAYSKTDFHHLQRFDPLSLSMIEQPLGWDDHVDHAELQKIIKTPICLDESICSPAACRTMLTLGSGRVVNLKPGRVGGLRNALKIHDFCRKNQIPLWVGGMLESGIGRAFNVALASLPGFTLPGDLSPPGQYLERDLVVPPWQIDQQGFVMVPATKPGIGVDIDQNYLAKMTVGNWCF